MQQSIENIIKKSVSNILPKAEITELINCLNYSNPSVSIRLNPHKINKHSLNDKVLWSNHGYYLDFRPAFTYDPFLHAGAYYVQEASSMFIEEIFRQINACNSPKKILDLCAAPGGKSTLISSLIHPESVLISNETDHHRSNILLENITKWGNINTVVCNNTPRDYSFLKNYFDVILADLPCSGEGMFRKDKNAVNEWSEKNVIECSMTQRKISDDILSTLKPYGYYIYSTCTFNQKENEDNIDYLLKKYGLKSIVLNIKPFKDIHYTVTKEGAHCYRFFPHKIKGEGFFVSVLQKTTENYNTPNIKSKKKFNLLRNINPELRERYSINSAELNLYEINNHIYNLSDNILKTLQIIADNLTLRYIPTPLFEIKNKDYLPTQAFANCIQHKIIPVNLSYNEAINYLMGATIAPDCPQGFNTVTYKNARLGWIKKIGLRINNYYPKNWRIRHTNKNEAVFLLSEQIEIM